MARTKATAVIDWLTPRLQDKSFALGCRVHPDTREEYRKYIEAEGGTLVKDVSAGLDFLVVDNPSASTSGAIKKSEELNRKGAHIQIIDRKAFFELFAVRKEELLVMLKAGAKGIERWNGLHELGLSNSTLPSLAGVDLRGMNLAKADLFRVNLNRADLRNANLSGGCIGSHAGPMEGLRLDGARLLGTDLRGLADSSLTACDLTGGSFDNLSRCTCTAANFDRTSLLRGSANQSIFQRVTFRNAHLAEWHCKGSDFGDADFTGATLMKCNWAKNNLTRARFEKAILEDCALDGAKLQGSSFRNADLAGCTFVQADLRHSDLSGANLGNADLTGAKLDGADFSNANTRGAKIDRRALVKAKGLSATPVERDQPRPHLEELNALAAKVLQFKTTIVLGQGEDWIRLEADFYKSRTRQRAGAFWHLYSPSREHRFNGAEAASLAAAMTDLANQWSGARPVLESIQVNYKKQPKGKDLVALTIHAWAEAFGVSVGDIQEIQKDQPVIWQRWREQLLAELRQGPKGVERWKQRGIFLHFLIDDFTGVDLRGADLRAFCPYEMNLTAARFDGANLTGARFDRCVLRSASFRDAILDRNVFESFSFNPASFEGADFRGARLAGAKFQGGKLHSADLSTANLVDVSFEGTEYDETTRWPADFIPPKGLRWVGKGPNPAIYHARRPLTALDFDGFLARLAKNVQPARLAKALAMLKAERFQLFAEASKDSLTGVVKSQTDPDLVYSCRLAADGAFACCTQNLKPCGGLKDALCKHLLVLIVGLAKADQLDRALVDRWVEASQTKHPALDKDVMSEAFIRYKGAEAGAVDWRPTETIPEDYYAL